MSDTLPWYTSAVHSGQRLLSTENEIKVPIGTFDTVNTTKNVWDLN